MKRKTTWVALFLFASLLALYAESLDSLHEKFLEMRHTLVEEQLAIYESYSDANSAARDQAILEWREVNRERILAVREIAGELGRKNQEYEASVEGVENRIAALRETELPDSLPPAQRAFLERRRELLFEQLEYEKGVADLPAPERDEALRQWYEESSEKFAELRDLARNASKEQEAQLRDQPYEIPRIPEGVTEEMRRFLEARYAMIAELHALERAHSDPAARDAAIMEWHENNRQLIENVQRLAQEAR